MNEKQAQVRTAKSKLLKAAQLVNQANGLLIRAVGGSQDTHEAERVVLKAAAGLDTIIVAEVAE